MFFNFILCAIIYEELNLINFIHFNFKNNNIININ